MIVYFSNVSGFTDKLVKKLELPALRIPLNSAEAENFVVNEEYVLITPTYGANGRDFVPRQVVKFLKNTNNRELIRGVIASGNRNFLEDFGRAGTIVSAKCQVPYLYCFELDGSTTDVQKIQKGLKNFWETR